MKPYLFTHRYRFPFDNVLDVLRREFHLLRNHDGLFEEEHLDIHVVKSKTHVDEGHNHLSLLSFGLVEVVSRFPHRQQVLHNERSHDTQLEITVG